jgi:hypothetical protein
MKMKYVLNSGYITQKVGKKTTVFSGEKSMLFTFNESAALIFQGLKLGWDEEKITEKLVASFEIDPNAVGEDIQDFTKELLDKKILTKVKY